MPGPHDVNIDNKKSMRIKSASGVVIGLPKCEPKVPEVIFHTKTTDRIGYVGPTLDMVPTRIMSTSEHEYVKILHDGSHS